MEIARAWRPVPAAPSTSATAKPQRAAGQTAGGHQVARRQGRGRRRNSSQEKRDGRAVEDSPRRPPPTRQFERPPASGARRRCRIAVLFRARCSVLPHARSERHVAAPNVRITLQIYDIASEIASPENACRPVYLVEKHAAETPRHLARSHPRACRAPALGPADAAVRTSTPSVSG